MSTTNIGTIMGASANRAAPGRIQPGQLDHFLNMNGAAVRMSSARPGMLGARCPACNALLQVRGTRSSPRLLHVGGRCADAAVVGEAAVRAMAWVHAGVIEAPLGERAPVLLERLALCRETSDGTLYAVAQTRLTAILMVLAIPETAQAEVLDTLMRITDCPVLRATLGRPVAWLRPPESTRIDTRQGKFAELRHLLGERWLEWSARPRGHLAPRDATSRHAAVDDVLRVLATAEARAALPAAARKALRAQATGELAALSDHAQAGEPDDGLGSFGTAFVWLLAWTQHVVHADEVVISDLADQLSTALPGLPTNALRVTLTQMCERMSPAALEQTGWQTYAVVR